MSKKKKWIMLSLLSICAILLCGAFLFVSISGEPLMAGGAVCISFDKWDMLRADKIIISYGGETHTVTDPAFVKAFSQETLAGTYSEYCCCDLDEGWVEIYRGDRLLRSMRYIRNHEAFAYEEDATHWVLFGEEGHAFLSSDMGEKLQKIISG